MQNLEPVLEVNKLCFTWPGQEKPLLCDFSLCLRQGSRLGLSGDNGCGKSTLLHIICGLVPPQSGQMTFEGRPLRTEEDFIAMRLQCGYLLQNSDDQLFCPTVLEDVAFGPLNQGKSPAEAEAMAWDALKKLDLERLAYKSGSRLSGGEKKMAALATILSMRPRLLLLDEPGNNLDGKNRARFTQVLGELNIPMLLVSHDQTMLNTLCDQVIIVAGSEHPFQVA